MAEVVLVVELDDVEVELVALDDGELTAGEDDDSDDDVVEIELVGDTAALVDIALVVLDAEVAEDVLEAEELPGATCATMACFAAGTMSDFNSYKLRRLPAPQYSLAFPAQGMLQVLCTVALTAAGFRVLPHQHSLEEHISYMSSGDG